MVSAPHDFRLSRVVRVGHAAGDLVIPRALGVRTAREAREIAEPWSPYRAYAAFHLWTEAAYCWVLIATGRFWTSLTHALWIGAVYSVVGFIFFDRILGILSF